MTSYSQTGEERVLSLIFDVIGEGSRFLVDLGAGDGRTLSNTRALLDDGWRGARFDLAPVVAEGVAGVRLTAENVVGTLMDHGVPDGFDFLSLDLDGVDWYVLRSILRAGFRPRVICCEINACLPAEPPVAIVYDPTHAFDETSYYGASLGAYHALVAAHGYRLVHVQQNLNAFFVRVEAFPDLALIKGLDPTFTQVQHWPPDPRRRPWHPITFEALT